MTANPLTPPLRFDRCQRFNGWLVFLTFPNSCDGSEATDTTVVTILRLFCRLEDIFSCPEQL